jgi:thymidine kinase
MENYNENEVQVDEVEEFIEELIQDIFEVVQEDPNVCFHCLLKDALYEAFEMGYEEGTLDTVDKFRFVADVVEDNVFEVYEEE